MHINRGLLLPGKCSSMAPPAAAMKNCRWGLQWNKAAEKCWAAERKSDNIWTGTDCWKGKRVCVRERKRHGRGGRKGAHRETGEDKKYEWVVGRTWKERIWKLTQIMLQHRLCAHARRREILHSLVFLMSLEEHTYGACTCAPVQLCVYPREKWLHSRWIARKRGPKEGEEPEPKSGEFRLFSRPGDACTVILWMKSATHTNI